MMSFPNDLIHDSIVEQGYDNESITGRTSKSIWQTQEIYFKK